jgi:4'-phosphopantetheinyl transferase EntD
VSLLRTLLPDWALVADIDPRLANPEALPREERAIVAAAVESRRREFAAGRMLARRLLQSLGFEGPLNRMRDGTPAWPPGIVGSITHCATLAAAVCRSGNCAGLGIDVDIRQPLPSEVAVLVLTSDEAYWTASREANADAGILVFCAKEAFYKAIYPLTRQIIEFDSVNIMPARSGAGFSAELLIDVGPFRRGDVLPGSWNTSQSHVAAAVAIDRAMLANILVGR